MKTRTDPRPLCLIAEDEPFIGCELEAQLGDLGYRTGAVVATAAEALVWLKTNTPQLAMLDINLRDGPCGELARALKERSVPFVICSGLDRDMVMTPDFVGAPWIGKPASFPDVRRALAAVLPAPREPSARPAA